MENVTNCRSVMSLGVVRTHSNTSSHALIGLMKDIRAIILAAWIIPKSRYQHGGACSCTTKVMERYVEEDIWCDVILGRRNVNEGGMGVRGRCQVVRALYSTMQCRCNEYPYHY